MHDNSGFGRVHAARDLLLSLPPEVTSTAEQYLLEGPDLIHFRHFFEVWDAFTSVADVRASEPVGPGQRMEALDWKKGYEVSVLYPSKIRLRVS